MPVHAALLAAAVFVMCANAITPAAAQPLKVQPLTAQQALDRLQRDGRLDHALVGEPLDLARLRRPRPLSITGSTLAGLRLIDASWPAALELRNLQVDGALVFDRTRFEAPLTLHNVRVIGPTSFAGAHFDAAVAITFSRFMLWPPLTAAVDFSDTRFGAETRFDGTFFHSVVFDSSRFATDVSFRHLVVEGSGSWRNVVFAGDAEFRQCRLGDSAFGSIEQMTAFQRLADFRGCTIGNAGMDYVDFLGDLLLANARICPGSLSLQQSAVRGVGSDWRGLKVLGPLRLEGVQLHSIQWQWRELGDAIGRANPSSDVLRRLLASLEAQKQESDVRTVSALLADRVIEEQLQPGRGDVGPGQRLWLWIERLLWGWSTGYGTRLDRIVGIALAVWAISMLPLLVLQGWSPARMSGVGHEHLPLHQALPSGQLQPPPATRTGRCSACLAYGFGLMFGLPGLRWRPNAPLPRGMKTYLLALRGVGLLLIALMLLTLTRVSPALQAVLGKLG